MKKLFIILTLSFLAHTSYAQNDEDFKYMRGSLCIMMVEHPALEFNEQIGRPYCSWERCLPATTGTLWGSGSPRTEARLFLPATARAAYRAAL